MCKTAPTPSRAAFPCACSILAPAESMPAQLSWRRRTWRATAGIHAPRPAQKPRLPRLSRLPQWLAALLISGVGALASSASVGAAELAPEFDWLLPANASPKRPLRHGAATPPVFRAALALTDSVDSETPAETQALLDAIRAGDTGQLKALLKAGAPVNLADTRGERALALASRAGRLEMVRQLLDQGANPDLRGSDGMAPLSSAALAGNVAVARLLLKAGADVDRRGAHGNTPLHDAIRLNRIAIVEALLPYRPNLECQDRDGLHALALAAREGHGEILAALLAHGAAVDLSDRDGRPALFWAIYTRQRQSTDLLLAGGANPGAMSTDF
ncbi:ankyrin repeat domain-containing protein [Rhodocyclus tenuis]|nr:ankyrin repeat domain-containing protein [Rhodocyclus gracilis]